MSPEILALLIFSLLFVMSMGLYLFGDRISFKKNDKKKKDSKGKGKPKVTPPESEKAEGKQKTEKKLTRPVLLSPQPMKIAPPTEEEPEKKQTTAAPSRPRIIDDDEIGEIKRFIERRGEENPRSSRQGLSDYNKIEEFGEVIDIDDSYPNFVTDYDPYINRPKSRGESEFLKNRGSDKKLYEELKNMSPEMKKIIMADILKRKN